MEARLKWRGKQPLTLLELRAWQLQPPLELKVSTHTHTHTHTAQTTLAQHAWSAAIPVVSAPTAWHLPVCMLVCGTYVAWRE